MDYAGQHLCETIYQCIAALSLLVGIIHGMISMRFLFAACWVLGGFAIASILCIPNWPFYNKTPMNWQPAVTMKSSGETKDDSNQANDNALKDTKQKDSIKKTTSAASSVAAPDNSNANAPLLVNAEQQSASKSMTKSESNDSINSQPEGKQRKQNQKQKSKQNNQSTNNKNQ
jgi:signal peptidase complex subunit 1